MRNICLLDKISGILSAFTGDLCHSAEICANNIFICLDFHFPLVFSKCLMYKYFPNLVLVVTSVSVICMGSNVCLSVIPAAGSSGDSMYRSYFLQAMLLRLKSEESLEVAPNSF